MTENDLARATTAFCDLLRVMRAGMRPVWSETDLTMAQLKALIAIVTTGGMTGRDLAERLGIGPSAVTPLVDRLVAHGYVRREEDAADRRVTWARPTASAQALFEELNAANREQFERLLSSLGPDDLATVRRALEILTKAATAAAPAR